MSSSAVLQTLPREFDPLFQWIFFGSVRLVKVCSMHSTLFYQMPIGILNGKKRNFYASFGMADNAVQLIIYCSMRSGINQKEWLDSDYVHFIKKLKSCMTHLFNCNNNIRLDTTPNGNSVTCEVQSTHKIF